MIRPWLTRFGVLTSHPAAFLVVVVYTAAWIYFSQHPPDWHGVATLATWLMTLFIQRAEHRDTQGIHAKLDELLRTHAAASNELTHIDEREPEEIEQQRGEAQAADRSGA
jgi:low affinity Fe/Cu permease